MRTIRLQHLIQYSVINLGLVLCVCNKVIIIYSLLALTRSSIAACSSVFPHHHHHQLYLPLSQRISVITTCISPAYICGDLQCGLLHDTGLALLQIMTTNYYSKKFLS